MVGHMEYEEKHTGVCPARTITCRTHTSVNQPAIPEAPFHPLPSMEILFERTYLGPFHWSAYGFNLVLVLMDYGMQWFLCHLLSQHLKIGAHYSCLAHYMSCTNCWPLNQYGQPKE